jgi:hypothetical protein
MTKTLIVAYNKLPDIKAKKIFIEQSTKIKNMFIDLYVSELEEKLNASESLLLLSKESCYCYLCNPYIKGIECENCLGEICDKCTIECEYCTQIICIDCLLNDEYEYEYCSHCYVTNCCDKSKSNSNSNSKLINIGKYFYCSRCATTI